MSSVPQVAATEAPSAFGLRTLVDRLPGIVLVASASGDLLFANARWHEYTALPAQAALGDGWKAAVHRLDAIAQAPAIPRLPAAQRLRLRRSDGAWRWHLSALEAMPLADGAPGWLWTLTDVHEDMRAQAGCEARAQELRTLVDHAPDPVVRFDPRGRVRMANAAFEAAFGVSARQAQGKTLARCGMQPGLAAAWAKAVAETAASGVERTVDLALAEGDAANERRFLCRCVPERGRTAGRGATVLCVVYEVTAQWRTIEALGESERRFRELTEHMDDVFWMARSDRDTLLYVNPAFERVFGWPRERLIAAPGGWREAVVPEDRATLPVPWFSATPGSSLEYRIKRADGRVAWLRDRRFAVGGAGGWIAGIVEDVTERKARDLEREHRLERERHAREEAEALGRAKDEFLAVISHELRSPLNAIRGWVHVLRHSEAGSRVHAQAVDGIERNSAAQLQLVEDLLDSARLVAGQLDIEPVPVDPAMLVEAVIEHQRVAADARGIAIRVEADPRVGIVEIDPLRLEQIVRHLVSNAVRHGRDGGRIDVAITARPRAFELTVTDDGSGIAPEFLPLVFDRFRQADGTTTRRQGGLGLGLFLVRGIVELHGGFVRAASAGRGQGARFSVELPQRAAAAHLREVPHGAVQLAGLRVAVVDADREHRQVLRALLQSLGASVETFAEAGALAAELARGTRVDALLCDAAVDPEAAMSALSALRANEASRAAPGGDPGHGADGSATVAVALLPFGELALRERVMAAGFDAHAMRPLRPDALADLLHSLRASRARPSGPPNLRLA